MPNPKPRRFFERSFSRPGLLRRGAGVIALLALFLLCPLQALAAGDFAGTKSIEPWRIRFLEAAIVQGGHVLLGEVAVPLGDMPPGKWEEMSGRSLWVSPDEGGRPVNMTRPRLQEAVMRTMSDLAPYCLFPGSMAVQRGGALVGNESVRQIVEKELAPHLAALPGESVLRDYRLPRYIFLAHAGERVVLEPPRKTAPGRLSLHFLVREMDGSIRQKLTGSVFIDCFADVPVSIAPMNRDDLLEHDKITFKRINLATLRGAPWDGRGGPWRTTRPIPVEQVIYQSDVAHVPTVRKGNMVTLIYEGANVRLTMRAEAMADGAAGEKITVRNTRSKREVYAMVRDSGTVIIDALP